MEIKDIKPTDAGKFICNTINEYHLIVVESPLCLPSLTTLKEDVTYDFTCTSAVSAFEGEEEKEKAGSVEWTLGETELYGREESASSSVSSAISYTAKYLDHGKKLSCRVDHPNWDPKFPKPSCSFEKFNVQFEPKIDCPSEKLFFPSALSL